MRSIPQTRFGNFVLYNKKNVSGCKVFDGEDLEYKDREEFQLMQQNEWFKQQQYEREKADQQHKAYLEKLAKEDVANNRIRCMNQAAHEQQVRNTNENVLDYNRLLAEVKKEKELYEKKKEAELDRRNYLEAENCRKECYAHLKGAIDVMKNTY